jgi:H/ACA ribonucleoprotein complex subunit 4
LVDAFEIHQQQQAKDGGNGDDTKLRKLIKPIEHSLEGIRAAIVRDTAVDALCHGAQLAVPGVIALPKDLAKNELVGVYTIKGEIVGLAQALMTREEIEENTKGVAFNMRRIVMKSGTYPKAWRSSTPSSSVAPSSSPPSPTSQPSPSASPSTAARSHALA